MMKRHGQIAGVIGLLILGVVCAAAQLSRTASEVRIEMDGIYGPLFITIAGKEQKIAEEAQKAWIISGGADVVYSSSDGAGGYENEGQGLHIYNVRSGERKRIMSGYYMIEDVQEVVTSKKKRVLLVRMIDGGLGASYIAAVDPRRGEVFFWRWARVLQRKGDIVTIGFYHEEDWEKLDSDQGEELRPYKIERRNLNSLLLRPVIHNKRDQ